MLSNTLKNLIIVLGIGIGSLLLMSCGEQKAELATRAEAEEAHHDEAEEAHVEAVTLSPEVMEEFGIEVGTAGPGKVEIHLDLTGEIKIDPDRLAHIIPRFPGIVKEVRKKIGDEVKKGEVLAVIESNESLAPYEVKSLIDGVIIEMHLTRGEVINDNTHAFIVADLSYVWADLTVYQKDLPRVKIGQKAIISASPAPVTAEGRISYISPVVDEATRTAIARVVLPNYDRQWLPGMFITAKVIVDVINAPVVVPKTAIETYEDQTVVFVKTAEGFVPRPVELGRENDLYVEVLSGLEPGEAYVTKGGFTLKAELMKEAFSGGHGH
ncbi:MAG: efflux RND transporter periplasmic adaptor subunit [Calditrichaeota bacterium]|nr:efflux RND transporter periplasmic adaptor subunit [Calditrichota bacterium]